MKHNLLSVEEMQNTDRAAIASGIMGKTLMENAGLAVFKHIRSHFARGAVVVLCGAGNNGGDGFVVARLLKQSGWDVSLVLFANRYELTGEASDMADKWISEADGEIIESKNIDFIGVDIVVDAVFGTGLNRPMADEVVKIFKSIPEIPIVSVDIPSGIDGNTGRILGYARAAHSTVTFCRKKIGHLLYPARGLCGTLVLADIGIEDDHIPSSTDSVLENDGEQWLSVFKKDEVQTHKFKRGYVVIAGAEVMTGATRLAARAAQRAGAGYVVIASPEKASTLYRVSLSSVVVTGYRDTTGFSTILGDERATAFLIGPGMGYAFGAQERVLATLKLAKPTVLDADALSLFEGSSDLLFNKIRGSCVMTPHEGEFAKLFPDVYSQNIGKLEQARLAAKNSNAVIVFKGPDTIIASPDGRAFINSNAPSSLATAGSGDVLAGIVTSYLSQGNQPFEAAAAAVWLHGELGNQCGQGTIAEDLIDQIPKLLSKI